jgi:hypothetical protein
VRREETDPGQALRRRCGASPFESIKSIESITSM